MRIKRWRYTGKICNNVFQESIKKMIMFKNMPVYNLVIKWKYIINEWLHKQSGLSLKEREAI